MTFQMIWKGEQPMAWAASMTPLSTSRREASTSRATKGAAAMTSGGMEAMVPILVPTRSLLRGRTISIRIRKGTERRMLMTKLRTFITGAGRGRTPSRSPATSSTPRIRPSTQAAAVATTVE